MTEQPETAQPVWWVSPDGEVLQGGSITPDQQGRFHGPYPDQRTAASMAEAVRKGWVAPTATQDRAERAGARHVREVVTSEIMRRRAIGTTIAGGILLIIGYVVAGVTSNGNALCTSALGELGSVIDTTVAHDCGMYTTFNSLGSALIGLGWFLAIIGGILIAIWYGHRYVSSNGGAK